METEEKTMQPIISRHVLYEDKTTNRFHIHGILRDCIEIFLQVKNIKGRKNI